MKKILSLFIALLLIATLATASAERCSFLGYSIEAPAGWTSFQNGQNLILDDHTSSSWAKLNVKDFSDYADMLSNPYIVQTAYDTIVEGYVEGLGGTVETQYELEVAGVAGRAFTSSPNGSPVTGWIAFIGTDAVMVVMFDVDDPLAMLETLQIDQ